MKLLLRMILLVILICFTAQPLWAERDVKEAVVKVYTTFIEQDYDEPWKTLEQVSSCGSGCIIKGNRILTSAHVVADRIFVQVRKSGEAKKYKAEVEVAAHECDLALLRVDDDSFFSGTKPVEIGKLVRLGDEVTTYGFPAGGDKLCSTKGVVSRVEHTKYIHSGAELLACQIDAAINPGSSGGPVIKGDKLVGVAFEAREGENIGYIVPSPIIHHFLKDVKNGSYEGIPSLGVYAQKMENPSLREKYGMTEDQTGVLVNDIYLGSPAQGRLKVGDVILSIDGQDVENDATVEFREGERTFYGYVIQEKYLNDFVHLTILRDKQVEDIEIPLTKPVNFERLVPYERFDVPPTYYILGGLVFEPLTENYILTWGRGPYADPPVNLEDYFLNEERTNGRKEIVILVKVLADEINAGYHHLKNRVISQVNGRKISTMEDLVLAFEEHKGPYHVIVDESGYRIVLDRDEVQERSQEILDKFKIISERSEDLQS